MSEKSPDPTTGLVTLHSILEDMHLSAKHQYDDDGSDVNHNIQIFQTALYDLAGDKAKTVCLTPSQRDAVYAALEMTDTGEGDVDVLPFERRAEIAASLIQLGIRADCSRCTNEECAFRRSNNPNLQTQVKGLYNPMGF